MMKRKAIGAAILIGLGMTSCGNSLRETPNNSNQNKAEIQSKISKTDNVIALLKTLETGDTSPLDAIINPNKYIQHNLAAPDGIAGLKGFVSILPKGTTKMDVKRIFQDGDFVFTHSKANVFGPKIIFDIFRFEGDKIVEHWDNIQEDKGQTPSGHTMIDGPLKATDLDKTEANKTLVKNFVTDILVNGKMEQLAGYFDGDNYIQHNPFVADQLSGLGKALAEWAKQGITLKYDKIHHVIGQGNFVLVTSEGDLGGVHNAFYDLFRVENGKIAEHWDTVEPIPAKKDWKNENGKF